MGVTRVNRMGAIKGTTEPRYSVRVLSRIPYSPNVSIGFEFLTVHDRLQFCSECTWTCKHMLHAWCVGLCVSLRAFVSKLASGY